ncbi:MAG TPA: hypothetical protein EYG76_04870 [Methanothermococcus okinawensis]|uniref:Uncharacterized protein n=1 Tax=Methanothermococcus okinawensis TaxID=155863 RepID=A0A832YSW5_9EURY|nr:hypothetical protein [Methanothermococcus okinawensis]
MKHRELNNQEIKCIKLTLNNYLNKEGMEEFNFENLYLLYDNDRYNVIYSTDGVLRYLKLFKRIYGAGILFGNFGKNKNKIKFSISLEGMDLISKNIVKNYAIINKKGETLFLYGRDIFKSSILKLNGAGRIGIFNENKEFLGIGNYNKGEVIKNIIDKGWYLRKGG